MPRRRKDYRVAPSPELLIGNPSSLVVNMIGTDGALERSFDFGLFDGRPMMVAELALAFRHHHADKGPATQRNT